MSSSLSSGLVASGDINPARFVKISGVNTLAQAGANEEVYGISGEGSQEAPVPGASALAATSGNPVNLNVIYGPPCFLEAGTGGWTAGNKLKSDSNGKGVVAASTGTTIQNIGALALTTVAAGERGLVRPVLFAVRPALS